MRKPHATLPRFAVIAGCLAFAITLSPVSSAQTGDAIRIWVVGSPHRGDTPRTPLASRLREESTRLGYRLSVETFPAQGFATTFFDAVARNDTPDVLVFNNFGVMDGITTGLGRFKGIGRDHPLRQHFVKVTGAFDELLGPERGWTYLFALSPNYTAARMLALQAPQCPDASTTPTVSGEPGRLVSNLAKAYVEGDTIGVQTYSDPDRLPAGEETRQITSVAAVRLCGMWGNDRLAVASVNAAYEAQTMLGHARVLLVLRKPALQWQLLVAARDPISNNEFVKAAPRLTALLTSSAQSGALPIPATLLSPTTGNFPRPQSGQRFGSFRWRSSPSDDVVAEIVEFAYDDDARVFLTRPAQPGSRGEISAGQLWSTRRAWYWRIWSVSRTGDLVFSDARTFTH